MSIRIVLVAFALLLGACVTAPQAPLRPADPLLRDALFAAPSRPVPGDDRIFALSEPMQRYLNEYIRRQARLQGRELGLAEALYRKSDLKLEYDSAFTRNAAEAFEARAGNCLSLVLMTAAFAKAMDLKINYQSAFLEETWTRSADLLVRNSHINITLGPRMLDSPITRTINSLTIDFLPVSEIRGMRVRDVDEDTVVAMYLNNRAAEMLADGHIDEAYWWTREAVRRAPRFGGAHVTLAVLYTRLGELDLATRVLDRVLELEPNNTQALANLGRVYERQGRTEEARTLRQRLARLEPQPPFHYFDLGMAAMARKDYVAAKALFAKEVDRADYHHEFHFWLAQANYQLGEVAEAREHLMRAMKSSTARSDRDLYAAKLAWLREHGVR